MTAPSFRVFASSLALFVALSPLPAFAQAQDTQKENSGGLFGGLEKMLPKSAQGLANQLGEVVDSAADAGKKQATQILDSVADANSKKAEVLAYLDEKLAGRTSSVTDAQVQAYARELIPLVETINERKFTTPPRVVIGGNLQVIQALAQDFVPQFEKLRPGVSKPLVYLQAYLAAALWTPALLGKYSPSTRTVYLMPANLDAQMKRKGISPAFQNDMLKLVLGHELTHALQDQEVGITRIVLATNSRDAMGAVNATIEGHGMFSENAVAKRAHLEAAARELVKLTHEDDLEEDAWLFERIAHVQAVQFEQIYEGGERFIAWHHRKGGMPAVWSLLMAPPQRSSMISQPETYTTTPPPLPDYEVKFMPLKARLNDSVNWAFSSGTTGDFQLRGMLSDIDHATREQIMQNLAEMAYVTMLHRSDLNREIDLALFKFKDARTAGVMAAALEKILIQSHKDMERNSRLRVRSMQQQPYTLAGKPSGIEWSYEVEAMLLGKTSNTEVVASLGSSVVTMSESDSGLSRTQMDALIRDALARFGTSAPAPTTIGMASTNR